MIHHIFLFIDRTETTSFFHAFSKIANVTVLILDRERDAVFIEEKNTKFQLEMIEKKIKINLDVGISVIKNETGVVFFQVS